MINKKIDISKNFLLEEDVKIFDYFFEIAKNKGNKRFYILSNQDYNTIVEVLKRKNIIEYFNDIYCPNNLNITKSYFLENINEYITIDSKSTIIFEDSNSFCELGKKLGFFTVGIEASSNKNKLVDSNIIIDVK